MDLNAIHKYPLVRILIPLLGGIIFADFYNNPPILIGLLIAAELSLLVILYFLHLKNRLFQFRWAFGGLLMFFLFLLGATRVWIENPQPLQTGVSGIHLGTIRSEAQFKSDRQHYLVTLQDSLESKILLYLPADSLSNPSFRYGDVIAINGRVTTPSAPLFESDFNYARYLKHKSIAGVCFVQTNAVSKLSEADHTVEWWFNCQRKRIYQRYQSLGLSGNQLALVSALTLGIKDDFSLDLKQAYSSAGVSHVLALSGLHIGLLFFILMLCLKPLVRFLGLSQHWALLSTVVLLWLFALFVGASPSVIRSVLLFSLLGGAILFRRRGNSLNSLAFVAFSMLLFNPYWLFDIGFILSFSAVLSILLFYPLFASLLQPKTLVGRYLWGLIAVSLAAQLGTLPWILYYFESFPVYFLLANLLIIPLITILLYLLVGYVLLLWIPGLSAILTSLVLGLTAFINGAVTFIRNLPCSCVNDVCIYPSVLISIFVMLFAFYGLLKMHKPKFLFFFLSSILLLGTLFWFEVYRHYPDHSFKLITQGQQYFLECVQKGGKLSVVLPTKGSSMASIAEQNHRRWLYSEYTNPEVINSSVQTEELVYEDGVIFFDEVSVMLASESAKQKELIDSTNSFSLDYLILDKKSFNKLEVLLDNYKFSTILATFNLSIKQKKLLIEICQANNVDYIFLDRKAYVEFLP